MMDFSDIPLRPLHLPNPISWWPLAPGWWIVIASLILIICLICFRIWQKYKYNAPKRFALKVLKKIEADYQLNRNDLVLIRKISELLRRTMLAYQPRCEIAGLTGDDWMKCLDQGLSLPYFQTEGAEILLKFPYQDKNIKLKNNDIDKLLRVVRMRLSMHIVGKS